MRLYSSFGVKRQSDAAIKKLVKPKAKAQAT
jgi:hypothetical protein